MKTNKTLFYQLNHDPLSFYKIKKHPSSYYIEFKGFVDGNSWRDFIKSFRLFHKEKILRQNIDIPESYDGFIFTYVDTDTKEEVIVTNTSDILNIVEE